MSAVGENDFVAHKRDGQCGGRARSRKARHQLGLARAETHEAKRVGGKDFARGAGEYHHAGGEENAIVRSHGLHIDDHAHANQEVGDEKRVAHKFNVVHQRTGGWDFAVEHQPYQECPQDAFHTHPFHQAGTEKNECQYEDILHHIVLETAEKAAANPRKHHDDAHTQPHQSRAEQEKVETLPDRFVSAPHNGQYQEG